MYIRILDTDDWIVEYDAENNQYRVSYFQDNHFVDEILFGTCETKMNKIVERLKELEEEHPYKLIGQPNTYNLYNEGWQDCIDRVLGIVKSGDESRENMQESTNTSERILVGERLPDKIWEQLKSLRMGEGEQK